MSDLPQNTAIAPPQGTGENLVEFQQEAADQQQPKYITQEEARAIAREELKRSGQSLSDKTRNRIEALEKSLAELRSTGVTVTPAQEEQMRQEIQSSGEAVTPTPAQAPAQQPPPDPYTADAWKAMQDAGIWITEEDPEFGNIDQSSGYNFVTSIKRLVEEKRQRLLHEAQPPETRIPGLTSGGVNNPNNLKKSNEELFQTWLSSRNGR